MYELEDDLAGLAPAEMAEAKDILYQRWDIEQTNPTFISMLIMIQVFKIEFHDLVHPARRPHVCIQKYIDIKCIPFIQNISMLIEYLLKSISFIKMYPFLKMYAFLSKFIHNKVSIFNNYVRFLYIYIYIYLYIKKT